MKNDIEWTSNHLPIPLKPARRRDFLDWEKIDEEMLIKVEKACQEIYEFVPPKRVSITEIIRRVGHKKWIENRELKLPKTTQTINKNLEPLDDFMIRKIRFVENKYIEERKLATKPQLMTRAAINNKTTIGSEKVLSEVYESLERIRNS